MRGPLSLLLFMAALTVFVVTMFAEPLEEPCMATATKVCTVCGGGTQACQVLSSFAVLGRHAEDSSQCVFINNNFATMSIHEDTESACLAMELVAAEYNGR